MLKTALTHFTAYEDLIGEYKTLLLVVRRILAVDVQYIYRYTYYTYIFLQFVTPFLSQELRPDTIRGRFGVDRARSAVHCTDLPQDGVPECEYCFRLI